MIHSDCLSVVVKVQNLGDEKEHHWESQLAQQMVYWMEHSWVVEMVHDLDTWMER